MYTIFNSPVAKTELRASSIAINHLNDGEIGGETYGIRLLISQIEPPAGSQNYCYLTMSFAEAEDLMARLGRAIGYPVIVLRRQ